MLFNFIDRVSGASAMRRALDVSSERTRGIANRVAQATLGNADGFALPTDDAAAPDAGAPVDIESEMVALADEQIRFEMTAKLLERTYAKIRTSIRGQ